MTRNIATLLMIIVAASPATAAIIFDTGSPNGEYGGISGSFNTLQFMNFPIGPGANVITGITWYGAYQWFNPLEGISTGPAWETDSFVISIHEQFDPTVVADVGGPITRTPTGLFLSGAGQPAEIFQYAMTIAPLELARISHRLVFWERTLDCLVGCRRWARAFWVW